MGLVNTIDNANLARTKQQDTQQDLGMFNNDIKAQQQNNFAQDSARNQFNTTALGDYSGYLNTSLNDQNNFQTQGLADYSNYMNQGQANQQQRFNTLDSQAYQQQQFRDNQLQQNTQFLENHPMTMQYNNGNQTQTFTQSLRRGGKVYGHYDTGGVLHDFPVKGPMGNALLEDKPIQKMAKPGLAADSNEPGGYGFTLQNLKADPDPKPWDPGKYMKDASAVSGQGNLSPTATGGSNSGSNTINFSPTISASSGPAYGGSGASALDLPTTTNSSPAAKTASNTKTAAPLPLSENSERIALPPSENSGRSALPPSETSGRIALPPSENSEETPTPSPKQTLAITQFEHGDPRNYSSTTNSSSPQKMSGPGLLGLTGDSDDTVREHNKNLLDSGQMYAQKPSAQPKERLGLNKPNPDSYMNDLRVRSANGLDSGTGAIGALEHRNYVRSQDPYNDRHFDRSLSDAMPSEIQQFNKVKKENGIESNSDQDNQALWKNYQKSIQYDNQKRVEKQYNQMETSNDPEMVGASIGELNRLGILRKQGEFLHNEKRPMRASDMEGGPLFRQKLGGYSKGYEDIAKYVPEKPSKEMLRQTKLAAGPFAPKNNQDYKSGGMISRQNFAFGGMPQMPDFSQPQQPQQQPGFFSEAEKGYNQGQNMNSAFSDMTKFGSSGLYNEQLKPDDHNSFWNAVGQVGSAAFGGGNKTSSNPVGGAVSELPKVPLKTGGMIQSFKQGGQVSDQPIFTRDKSLRESSHVNDHPFKFKSKSSNLGNYGGFEVSNDDDCPKLNLPFKPGFRQ